jgi:hypothetical protein
MQERGMAHVQNSICYVNAAFAAKQGALPLW